MIEWATLTYYTMSLRNAAITLSEAHRRRLRKTIIFEWRTLVHDTVQNRRRRTAQAHAMWLHRAYAMVFYPWRGFIKRSQRVKTLNVSALFRIQNTTLASAFSSLALYVKQVQSARLATLDEALKLMMQNTRQYMFKTWQEWTRGRIEGRHNAHFKVMQRLLNHLLATTFTGWHDYVVRKDAALRRVAFIFGDGHLIAQCFTRWQAMWTHAASVKQKQWLLQDLKVVGTGWLVETLDQVFSSSLPINSELHLALADARSSRRERTGSLSSDIRTAWATGDVAIELPDELLPQQFVPQPPGMPRSQPAAPGRPQTLAGAGASAHEASCTSLRAASPDLAPPQAAEGEVMADESTSQEPDVVAHASQSQSSSLQALCAFLEEQRRSNDVALRTLSASHAEVQSTTSAETQRLSDEVRLMRELQLEHARIAYEEAAKRQGDAVNLNARVVQLTDQLADSEEQVAYLKEMLYSMLTSGQSGPIKPPASKKILKPIKPTRSTPATPWNLAADPAASV